jgi:hypothetical protein
MLHCETSAVNGSLCIGRGVNATNRSRVTAPASGSAHDKYQPGVTH